MAAVQEPEVQFAQRLASNEKPIRTRAMKKLRKYISVRSQRDTGGFTGDELLKLWKGLFYCLWMQDKPLLQEELSNQISSLLHNFQTVDRQFLYLESFLQTFKREWTGIDRLRMDKFFQLVRFMFRQTFEMLKRKNWDSSLVGRFLELLTAQLLHSSSEAPSGLQFHVLDLYMTELAVVGSQELTADQNLTFIEPFCKTAAKTKDGILFRAICSSIFSTIIDQAPFAIDDLMKELKAAEASDSDSGQASEEEEEEEEEEQPKEKTVSKPAGKNKRTEKQVNGKKSNDDEDEDDDDDDDDEDDDELLHLEDSDTEAPGDEDVGPVLQFDYAALANRLFELASRSNTPSQNRQRLYKIIKVLRDLSEGIFPQDEYPEEVSTDEDDDSFGSRKRMKRRGRRAEEEEEEDEEGAPASKKRKKKEAAALDKQDEDSAKDDCEPADLTANTENKNKKRKKKKAEQGGGEGGENAEHEQTVIKETEVSQTQSSVASVKVTQAATPEGQPETLLVSEVKKQPSVTVTEETSQPETGQTPAEVSSDAADAAVAGKKKKKKKRAGQAGGEGGEDTETSEQEQISQTQSCVSSVKVTEAEDPPIAEETSQLTPEEQPEKVEAEGEQQTTAEASSNGDVTASGKKKKKKKKGLNVEETEAESQVNGANTDAGVPSKREDSAEDGPTSGIETQTDSATPAKKKSKKKNLKTDEAAEVEVEPEIPSAGGDAAMTPLKKKTKKKGKQEDTTLEAPPAADESSETPLKKKKRKNNLKEPAEEDRAAADAEEPSVTMTTPTKRKKKKPAAAKVGEIKDQDVSSSGKVTKKKKRKIPIVFEYEADELEAAASVNGLAEEEETAVKKTKLDGGEPSAPPSTKKSQKKAKTPSGSDFITFQSDAAVPTPLFCKTKGGLSTPRSAKKKSQTPKSESKKVTFGLKNNKTAEFRKTDRSLLVSPDGSSRVPFDPKQKPKFGVLKSPATPLSTGAKKTPNGPRKTGFGTPKSTPKRRPSAADFF